MLVTRKSSATASNVSGMTNDSSMTKFAPCRQPAAPPVHTEREGHAERHRDERRDHAQQRV